MEPHLTSGRRHAADLEKVARTYEARIVFGKFALLLGAGGSLALVFLYDVLGPAIAVVAGVLCLACLAAVFCGDFPAVARCPACGRRMKVLRHPEDRRKRRRRYLQCPGCNESVELDPAKPGHAHP